MDNTTDERVSSRKIRKPLMERKRRARINRSLDELYHLITDTDFASKGTKLEKADILEMTVQYVKHIQQSDYSRENLENVLLERYLLGFEKCAEEVETIVDPELRQSINRHLRNCLNKVRGQKGGETPGKSCSVVIEEPKDLRILPSKLPNGDVLLLLSSKGSSGKCEVWRPWW